MDAEQFYKMPKRLARADGFVSRCTGELIPLTSSAKIVYTYMLSRNEFFTTRQSGNHYESQATIADACGLEYKATGKIIRMFINGGVFEGKKLRPNGEGQWRWFYHKVHKDVVLWEGTEDDYAIVDSLPAPKQKLEQKPVLELVQPYEHFESEEEYKLPF